MLYLFNFTVTALTHGGNVESYYRESVFETGKSEKHYRRVLSGMVTYNQELKWQALLIQSANIQDCLPHVQ